MDLLIRYDEGGLKPSIWDLAKESLERRNKIELQLILVNMICYLDKFD